MSNKLLNLQTIGPTYLCRKKMIIEEIDKIKPVSILEVGCGSGDLGIILSRRYIYYGLDLNKEAIINLKKKVEIGKFICGDVFNFNTRKKFDLVICCEVIEHIKNDGDFFRKLITFLKPGGSIILTTPGKKSKWSEHDILAGHYRRYEREELFYLAKKNKLKKVKVYSIGVPIANLLFFYNKLRAKLILNKINKKLTMNEFTINSGIKKERGLIGKILFNDLFITPFYLIQSIFSKTPFGLDYLLFAVKSE